ncbi:MAG: glycosyltransferase family 39 protein [Chloroflexi bacterium]|nr:glycosyltransferase family 39 protein [Chloroflexota bacterium]
MIARLRTPAFWLTLILAGALGLRLAGIGFGLPLHLHPDEPTQVLNAEHMLSGDLDPHFFRYPSLYIYQLFTIYGGAQLVSTVTGTAVSPSAFWLLGRILSVAYGTLCLWAVYMLGRALASDWVGVAAAGIAAGNPEQIVQSHYATVDVAMTFWIILGLTLAVRSLRHPGRSWVPVAVAFGLAVGTKYTALLFAAVVGAVLVVQLLSSTSGRQPGRIGRAAPWLLLVFGGMLGVAVLVLPVDAVLQIARQWSTDGTLKPEYLSLLNVVLALWRLTAVVAVLAGATALFSLRARRVAEAVLNETTLAYAGSLAATFVITSPYVLLDLPAAARDILYEYRHMSIGAAAQFSTSSPLQAALLPTNLFPQPLYYAEWWLSQSGWLLTAAALLGLALALRQRWLPNLTILACIVLLGLTLTRAASKADRYALPLVPIIAVWAGAGLVWLARRFRSAAWAAVVTTVVLAWPLTAAWDALQIDFLLPNTNVLAYQWVLDNVPRGASIIREDSTPDIEDATNDYRVTVSQSAFETKTLTDWRRAGVEYILVGRLRDTFYRPNASSYPGIVANYADLDSSAGLAAQFKPGANVAGPPIWIYRLQ